MFIKSNSKEEKSDCNEQPQEYNKYNRPIATMLSARDVAIIDQMVNDGYYCSRSDAIRAFTRYCITRIECEGVLIG